MTSPFDKPVQSLSLEIPFGNFRSASLAYPSNRIITRKFTWKGVLTEAKTQLTRNYGYLWLLLICAAQAVQMQMRESESSAVIFAVYGAALLFVFVKEALLEYHRIAIDRGTNSVPCRVWNGESFLQVTSGEVFCGDLLLVTNGETSVADVVLFTTEHPDGSCYVDCSQTLGSGEMSLKSAVPDVQRFVESSSLDRLVTVLPKVQGLIRAEPPNQDFTLFHGQLKLNRSPAAVPLSMDNFILRGSRVFGTGWVVCCVVGTGMETKAMLQMSGSRRPFSILEKAISKYTLFAICLIVLLVLMNMTGFLAKAEEYDGSLQSNFLSSVLRFYPLLPPMLFFLFQFVRFVQTVLINLSKVYKGSVRMNYFSHSSRFGVIDYVVAEKNCAFTVDKPHVHTLIFRDKVFTHCLGYDHGQHTCMEVVRRNRTKAPPLTITDDDRLLFSSPKEYTCTSTKSQSKQTDEPHESCGFRNLQAQMHAGESEDLVRMFECMVICNTIAQLEPLKAKNKFEEALVVCGQDFGFKALESAGDRMLLSISGTRTAFKIIASSEYNRASKRMRVIVDRSDAQYGTLFVKGAIEALGPLLDVEDELFERIRATELELKQQGLVPIMLACKQIDEDAMEAVKDRFWKAQASVFSMQNRVEALFAELEQNLQYLGIACIEDRISSDTSEGVAKLAKAGINLWVVGNDSETESLASCMRAGFFSDDYYIVPVKEITEARDCTKRLAGLVTEFIYKKPVCSGWTEEASVVMTPKTQRVVPKLERLMSEIAAGDYTARRQSNRELLTHPFDPTALNFLVIMDGQSFETALIEEESQRLLAALLFTSKVVCFFSCQPHQKAKIVRFLKHSFSFSPSVLTFADGLSSIPMLNESDIKVGRDVVTSEQSFYLYDATVKSLNALADFAVTAGRNNYTRAKLVFLLVVYENVLVVTVVAVYSGICGFTANSPIDSTSVWAVTVVATKPLLLYISLWGEEIPNSEAVQFPEIYRWGTQPLTYGWFIRYSLLLPFAQGAFAVLITLLGTEAAISPGGHTENSLALTGTLSVFLFVTICAHFAIESRFCFALWMSVLASFALFALEVTVFNYSDSELTGYLSIGFASPAMVLRLFPGVLFTIALSCASYMGRMMFKSSFMRFMRKRAGERQRLREFEMDLGKIWHPSDAGTKPKSGDMFERKPFWRTYKLENMERNYKISIFPEVIRHIQASFLVLALLSLSCAIAGLSSSSSSQYNALRVLFSAFSVSLLLLSFSNFYHDHYVIINKIAIFVLSLSMGVYQIVSGNSYGEVAVALPVMFFLAFYVSFAAVVAVTVVNVMVFVTIYVFNSLLKEESVNEGVLLLLSSSLDVIGVSLTSALAGYFVDDISREKFRLLTTKESELQKADNILKYLLPEFVRTRVKDGARFIAEAQPYVHILFCEICKFDHMVKDYDAVEVTNLLNNIYEKFDELCETCGVTKVETVGKVYMACVGVKDSQNRETEPGEPLAYKMLLFAFEMISALEQFRLADGEPVKIKIGIHSGPVIAGVVGYHKPQFSLVGDTVNTASRMCSTADEENSIQVSSATFLLLKDAYDVLFECKTKEVKGKGLMDVYTVWRDIGSRSYRGDIDAPEISPEPPKLNGKRQAPLARSATMGRRNSVFEASSGVMRFMQKNREKHHFWRQFYSQLSNSKYYQEILLLRQPVAVMGLISTFLLTLLDVGLKAAEFALGLVQWEAVLLRTLVCLFLCALLLLSKTIFRLRCFSWVAMGLLACAILCYFADMLLISFNFSSSVTMTVLMVLSAIHFTGMRSYQLLPFIVLTAGVCIASFSKAGEIIDENLRLACVLGELTVFLVYAMYRDARLENYFELKQAVTAEISKANELLENLLPRHIVDNVKLERAITDHLEDTTLLVADIVGFTAWSNDHEPSEVIELLSNLFSAFDRLCLTYKAYKVYTIGDCYVAMGVSGKKEKRDPRQECVNIVRMAQEMKTVIAQVNDDYFTNLNMRIGIHTGEIIGAIIGTNIVRYDIYGRDVLIAFKMEANSKPGLINVSEVSRSFLEGAEPNLFRFRENCTVDISAVDAKVKCFFTDVEKSEDSC